MPLRHKLPRRTSATLLARSAKTPTKKVDQPAAFHPELSVELKPFSSLSVNVFQRKPLHPLALGLTCILIALAFLFPRPATRPTIRRARVNRPTAARLQRRARRLTRICTRRSRHGPPHARRRRPWRRRRHQLRHPAPRIADPPLLQHAHLALRPGQFYLPNPSRVRRAPTPARTPSSPIGRKPSPAS